MPRPAPMVRYLTAATLARCADGGAAVGLVSLALSPTAHLHDGAATGGLLAALLTAPHLLGPWVARPLDRARDGRRVLAVAFAAYGVALAAGAALVGRTPLYAAAAMIASAGTCGPLLTGGLSSRLAGIAGPEDRSQRRAEGWDAVTYGLGGTAGPATVAFLAAATTPLTAMEVIGGAAIAAALIALTLPRDDATGPVRRDTLTVRAALRTVLYDGPLRRVMVTTAFAALGGAALLVLGVVLGGGLSARPGAGAGLTAVFGLGNLAGSLVVTVFPLRGDPERLTLRWAGATGVTIAICAVAPTYPAALAAFAVAGAAGAPLIAATLAARSRHAPDGARAQVFVTMAGLKMAMASAGSALAGLAAGHGPRPAIAGAALLILLAVAAAVLDRRLGRSGREAAPAPAVTGRGG